jgi:hypothetical protein
MRKHGKANNHMPIVYAELVIVSDGDSNIKERPNKRKSQFLTEIVT